VITRSALLVISCLAALLTPTAASANSNESVSYAGQHPSPAEHGGVWCNDAKKHTHSYVPDDYYLYSEHNGSLYFIGDPDDFGYTGALYHYWDHHRIDLVSPGGLAVTIGFCYIPGPHTHAFAPGSDVYFHQYAYNSVYYYYWYDDLWLYPGYSRYYDVYYDYWYTSYPTCYPQARPHQHVDVGLGEGRKNPRNGYYGYAGRGSSREGYSGSTGRTGSSSGGYSGTTGRGNGDESSPGYTGTIGHGSNGSSRYNTGRGENGSKSPSNNGNSGHSGTGPRAGDRSGSKGVFSGGSLFNRGSGASSGGVFGGSKGSSSGGSKASSSRGGDTSSSSSSKGYSGSSKGSSGSASSGSKSSSGSSSKSSSGSSSGGYKGSSGSKSK
jgi:hypothetical protein